MSPSKPIGDSTSRLASWHGDYSGTIRAPAATYYLSSLKGSRVRAPLNEDCLSLA